MKNNQTRHNSYWYDLPERLIAQAPANPRDSSKLLVYNTQNNELIITQFSELTPSLTPSTTLTFNDAKVVPARVLMHKETGGKIEVLFLVNEWISTKHGPIPCFLDRKSRVGEKLYFEDKSFCTVVRQEEGLFFLSWSGTPDDLLKNLDNYGTMPIPPYIKHSSLSRDELMEKYQTIFAKSPGSSAAPTASLHFTPEVFASLEAAGIKKQFITLHVGLGTFAPLTEANLASKTLHKEWYEVSEELYRSFEKSMYLGMEKGGVIGNKPDITAVGTTVVRTLESVARLAKSKKLQPEVDCPLGKKAKSYAGTTDLFIYPPFEFKVVNHLITNFHLPGSSLMMLVDAFLEHKKAKRRILELYAYAIEHEFRFYSFGDAMLIL